MDELWKILNDKSWVPRFGEVIIVYQDGIPILVSRKDQRKLTVAPCSRSLSSNRKGESDETLDRERNIH